MWDVEKGLELRALQGHTDKVHRVAVNADGTAAVSASFDGTLKVWDLKSGTCLATLSCGDKVLSCALGPSMIAAGDMAGRVYFWRQIATEGRTILVGEIHEAVGAGDLQRVKALLTDKPDLISSTNNGGATPLHYAAAKGHMDIAEMLLTSKASVNAKDNAGCTPLHNAVCGRLYHYDSLSHLGDAGFGVTPFDSGKKDLVELLLANKADINATDNERHWTPLHHAASVGRPGMAELLLDRGADVNAQSAGGHTPLSLASSRAEKMLSARRAGLISGDPADHILVSKVLLAYGADVNVKDDDGRMYLTRLFRNK